MSKLVKLEEEDAELDELLNGDGDKDEAAEAVTPNKDCIHACHAYSINIIMIDCIPKVGEGAGRLVGLFNCL